MSDLDCIQGWKTASLLIAHLLPPLCMAKCRFVLRPLGFLVSGYTPGTPYKVSCSPTSGAVPPYSSSPNPYQTAVYPVRSAYPQQSPYAQVGLGHTGGSSWCSWVYVGRVGSSWDLTWLWDPVAVVSLLPHSKARTIHSPCTQHPLMSSTTPRWCSPMACRQRCILLPSLHQEAMGSPWAWWLEPLWPCQQVS